MIIGIDPGKSGAACMINEKGVIIRIIKFDNTDGDVSDAFVEETKRYNDCQVDKLYAFIEKVHAMPKQGVSSTFKFGRNYGFIQGLLTAYKIPYEYVTPQKWQKDMGCMSKGDKNITKAAAQQLFPQIKITHAIADSMLIAEYGRRLMNTRSVQEPKSISKF